MSEGAKARLTEDVERTRRQVCESIAENMFPDWKVPEKDRQWRMVVRGLIKAWQAGAASVAGKKNPAGTRCTYCDDWLTIAEKDQELAALREAAARVREETARAICKLVCTYCAGNYDDIPAEASLVNKGWQHGESHATLAVPCYAVAIREKFLADAPGEGKP